MFESAMLAVATEDAGAGSLRAAVLGGPDSPVTAETAGGVLEALLCPGLLAGAVGAAGHHDVRRRSLPAAMTAGAVLGLCLFSGLGYDGVLSRVWPVTAGLRPGGGAGSADVASGPALAQARARGRTLGRDQAKSSTVHRTPSCHQQCEGAT